MSFFIFTSILSSNVFFILYFDINNIVILCFVFGVEYSGN